MTERTMTNPDAIKRELNMLALFGKGFTAEQVAAAYSLTISETTFSDKCSDYVEFLLADEDGKWVGSITIKGY